jgi:PAS domain S-box-containing protein
MEHPGEGIIKPLKTISLFWYRRICEMTLFISLIIVSVFFAGLFMEDRTATLLLVPLPAALIAGVCGIIGLISYLWAPAKYLYQIAFGNYLLLTATVGMLITLTGYLDSPYLVLWMLLTIFAGLFGKLGLSIVFSAVNGLLLYLVLFDNRSLSREFLIVYLLALEMPLVISYLIWNDRDTQEKHKTQAFDALAKQLSQVADKSEIVINAIDEGVMAIDAKGVIQLINPAAQRLIGWTREDALGLDYHSVLKLSDNSGHDLSDGQSPVQQVLISNRSLVNNDLTLTTNSGKHMLVSLVISPVDSGNGTSNGAIVVFRDITAEKQEERQRAEFISTASHEMRTPVAAIEGYLGLALNPNTAVIDEKARAYLMKAHEATQHLGRLFQDLLSVSRAEDGRLIPKPTTVDMTAFMRNVIEGVVLKAQQKGLTIYFKPGSDQQGSRTISPMYYAFVDNGHLREIANNLLDNAIKYTLKGSITVDLKGDEEHVTLSIADTGIGIPPEDVVHLFQKFYRIDNSDTREIGGTGLGLFICRRLAEANNGKVWVESSYGKGSTFFVQLPRVDHDETAEPGAVTSAPS